MSEEYIGKQKKMEAEGVLNSQYAGKGKGWFVKIKADYDNDRVIWTFVEQSDPKNRKADVYMDVREFYEWMMDVNSGLMFRTIENERAEGSIYPKEYKIIGGENGAKSVGFAPSTSAFAVINAKFPVKATGKSEYCNIPVTKMWLRCLATMFFATLNEDEWFKRAAKATLMGARNRFKPATEKEDVCENTEVYSAEETLEESIMDASDNLIHMEVSQLGDTKTGFAVKGITGEKKEDVIIFTKKIIETVPNVTKMRERFEEKGKVGFTCLYEIRKGRKYFLSFAS